MLDVAKHRTRDDVGVVRCRPVLAFVKGAEHRTRVEKRPASADEEQILARAHQLVDQGEIKYGFLGWTGKNCEHIARWVQTGTSESRQANLGNLALLIVGTVAAAKVME